MSAALRERLGARGLDWIVPDWPAPEGVQAVVTTRSGGVSTGAYAALNLGLVSGDDPAAVRTNQARVESVCGVRLRRLKQVHGARVVDAAAVPESRWRPASADGVGPGPGGEPVPPTPTVEADAALARDPGVAATVLVADCMPVFLARQDGAAVAVAHAGWRGLAAGVLEASVEALGGPRARLLAWLGPAIGPRAFEVGPDVVEAFCARDPGAASAFAPHRPGKWRADLFALARARLARAGVEAIHGGDLCTASDPARFFSHRRDRVTGRMTALIWKSGAGEQPAGDLVEPPLQ